MNCLKLSRLVVGGTLAVASIGVGQFLGVGTALAHHPEITAEVVCDEVTDAPIIVYTSTAWASEDPLSRTNPQIDIHIGGAVVGTGSYAAPTFSFSGTAALPAGTIAGDVVTVYAFAVGNWGNGAFGGQVASVDVTVPDLDCDLSNGRFTGGGNQVRVGAARVTRGLTIHCDLLLSNNLEVNWGGNQFHMTEHLTTVECSDDPLIIQAPPPAPLDTLVGVGTGRYNGTAGYTIEFTMVDYGEPGSNDQMGILIYETANPSNIALDVPLQVMSGGNLQAHYDQPHK
jgi:hypothetical protein